MKEFCFSVHLNAVKGTTDVKRRFHVLNLVTVSYQLLLNVLSLVYDSKFITGTCQTTTSESVLSV